LSSPSNKKSNILTIESALGFVASRIKMPEVNGKIGESKRKPAYSCTSLKDRNLVSGF